ncbi:molybdopterin-dependent oxidoreductase [Ideonella sp.]|uniref:molybdopterin-dependent oxidoreductase n=1 Tax=Ideonella sp. TaxID=1929293 RepID=UPI0035AFC3CF
MTFTHAAASFATLMALAASPAHAADSTECPAGAMLAVSGKIKNFNDKASASYRYSEAELLKLPTKKLKTGSEWTPVAEWTGPTIAEVLKAAGVDPSATKLRAVAHDGFAAIIPLTDLATYGPLVAHTKDGQRITDTKHGPLFVAYPRDQHPELQTQAAGVKFVWALCKIEVQ